MFVLGTAGHIDHGKSSLVEALTGINPDRLPEEQSRGMTIDLGFAWLRLADGTEIGIIDVPGHERFVRNMVAGAGGIHAAMLVVAADDGWMPQTQEHFDILRLLDIRHGLVALTKIDLVEPEWRELVIADIRAKLAGTFLAEAPIIPVSSVTKEGIPRILAAITDIARSLQAIADTGKPRLFIDRAFVLTGIGLVVTGTSRGGGFAADAEVYHFPSGDRVKIRALQSHERTVDRVGAGYRVAVNLAGVNREKIRRGDVIAGFPIAAAPQNMAVHVTNLADSGTVLKEGRRVLLILGTTEVEAVVRPFEDKGIAPGRDGLAIVKAVAPIAAFIGDRFILRLPTPQVTVGGGTVLDILDDYPRRKELPLLADYLSRRTSGELKVLLATELHKRLFTPLDDLLFWSDFSTDQINAAIREMEHDGIAVNHNSRLALTDTINSLHTKIAVELEKAHRSASYLSGLPADDLAKRINLPANEQFLLLLEYLEQSGRLARTQQYYHLPQFSAVLDPVMKAEADKIMAVAIAAGHNYPTPEELEKQFPGSRKTVAFLRNRKELVTAAGMFIMPAGIWKDIIMYVGDKLERDGQVTVAEYRDRFGNSRKYALPILEYLDRLNITRREGDFRIKGGRFDERHTL